MEMSDGLWVSDDLGIMSDGLATVTDGLGKVSDGGDIAWNMY